MASNTNRPIVGFHDIATDQYEEREMNDLEFADYQKEQQVIAKQEAEVKAKENAKSALLQRLGITAEEATLLLS